MKKLSLTFALLVVLVLSVAGCTTNQKETAPEKHETATNAFPKTITDAKKQQVIIKEKPERIVSLVPSNTEILYKLGLGKEVVGVSDSDNYPEDVKNKTKIGGMEINIEKVVSLNPDLVLAQASLINDQTVDALKQQGLKIVVVPDAEDFSTVYKSISLIGEATGSVKRANTVIKNMKSDLNKIEQQAKEIKEDKEVYVEISPSPDTYVAGKDTFVDEMLSIVHAKNVIHEKGWPKITEEAAIAYNPQVIVTTYGDYVEHPVEKVLSRPAWKNVQAVKKKDVFNVDSDLVSRAGPRLVEGVEALAEAIYPEVFAK